MSLAGKILAIFNALAALGFLAIAGMDYGARQKWSYSVFRHELVLNGLPATKDDDTGRPGRPLVNDLSAKTLADVFRGLGSPVSTQEDEVKSAQQRIKGELLAAGDDAAKRKILAGYILPMAKTGEEREQLIATIRKESVAAIEGDLDRRIGLCLLPTPTADKSASHEATPALSVKRQRIADLLFALSPTGDPAWQARVLAVVGLKAYTAAADRSAANLLPMIARLQTGMTEEATSFASQYEAVTARLKLTDVRLRAAETQLAEEKALAKRHTELFKARQSEQTSLEQQLQTSTQAAEAAVAALEAEQMKLFALQRELASRLESSSKLERDIRAKELPR